MAKGKRTGISYSGYYANYKVSKRWERNRMRKLEKQLREQPGNETQIKAAMARISYRRKTPTVSQWSPTKRRIAQLFKLFTGGVPKEALWQHIPAGKDAEQLYWKAINTTNVPKVIDKDKDNSRSMFSLALRMNIKR